MQSISKIKGRKVSFVLGGATKAATSTIYEFFLRHPGVAALGEESHYFSQGVFGNNYIGLEKEIVSFEDYYATFPLVHDSVQIGDFDRLTMHGPNAASLLREANPSIKVILILRNPIDRAYSHYWMDIRECFENRQFLDAVKDDNAKMAAGSTDYCPLVRLGFYAKQVRNLQETLGSSQVRVWLYEDFCHDAKKVLNEMCEFLGLGINKLDSFSVGRENQTSIPSSDLCAMLLRARRNKLRGLRTLYLHLPHNLRRFVKNRILTKKIKPPPMTVEARRTLINIYKEDIIELDNLLNRNLTHWLRDSTNPMSLPAEMQKAKQAQYFDLDTNREFEIERPSGCGRLYEWSIQSKFDMAIDMLSFPLAGASMLDLCCGSGMAAEIYSARGALVTGLDISEQSILRAQERANRHRFNARFMVGDAERLPFKDREFDIVAVHDGLHHLSNPHEAISEMARVARRAVIVIEPARSWLTRRAVVAGLAVDFEDAGNFVYRFREKEIFQLLADNGFSTFRHKQYMLYYRHEPFKLAARFEDTLLFHTIPLGFMAMSAIAPRLGNKLCVVCERTE